MGRGVRVCFSACLSPSSRADLIAARQSKGVWVRACTSFYERLGKNHADWEGVIMAFCLSPQAARFCSSDEKTGRDAGRACVEESGNRGSKPQEKREKMTF